MLFYSTGTGKDTGKLQSAEILTNVKEEKVEFSFPEVIKVGNTVYYCFLQVMMVPHEKLLNIYFNTCVHFKTLSCCQKETWLSVGYLMQ